MTKRRRGSSFYLSIERKAIVTEDVIGDRIFREHGHSWWDETGPFRILHALTPLRLSWVRDMWALHTNKQPSDLARPWLKDVRVLDVGCGGGLLCEPLARQGACVTGIDTLADSIEAARAHADPHENLTLRYGVTSLSQYVVKKRRGFFDLIVAFEVIEHTSYPLRFLSDISKVLKPGGLFLVSTLNRTFLSSLKALVFAESLFGWIPKGTHAWDAFLTPHELAQCASFLRWKVVQVQGLSYGLTKGGWHFSRTIDTNYFMAFLKNRKESLK